MDFEILYQPSYALVRVRLNSEEAITAEAGAMVSMSSGISLQTQAAGGFWSSLRRSFLGGESFFVNTFKATVPGEVTFAPPLPGDIVHLRLTEETVLVQSGSYLVSSSDITLDTKWAGARGFFAKEGLFLLRLKGTGDVFLSSYGAIHQVELGPEDSYTIDNGHVVAFEENARYKVSRVGGLKSTLLSNEALVCQFTGSGTVWLQTRSEDSLLAWLIPHLPKQDQSS
jgi:uncharacterized protein (TIGR00266 family)